MKVFRTDNGLEFVNKQINYFCALNGIKHEKTAPYSPQQNGVAERMNRSIFEKVRCLLFDAGLPKSFWGEAMYAAVDIINILPNNATDNLSPNEIWFGKKSEMNKIKIFGCKAMVMVPNEKRRKLDEKSVECIYLRLAEDAKAYRLYNKTTRKIVISRDVAFFEENVRSGG